LRTKKELRKEILQLRDALNVEERKEKSHLIAEKVIVQNEFIEADKILLFASFKSEVDTCEIFQAAREAGKAVYFPKIIGKEMKFYQVEKEDDLTEGQWGIREPQLIPEKEFVPQAVDKICIIMPGAVFDIEGNRIGYGGGYYDKFLKQIENGYKLAIAFDCQRVDRCQIAIEQYDVKVDCIVTERIVSIDNACK